jgi:DNA-binding response OmpR family regulator
MPRLSRGICVNTENLTIGVEWSQDVVQLTKMQTAAMDFLVQRMPSPALHDAMVSRLWNEQDEPEYPMDVLKVHIANLRKRIVPLGLTIKCSPDHGYFLQRVANNV